MTKAPPRSESGRLGRVRARAPRGPRRIAGVVLVAVSLLVGIQANAETDTLKIGVLATLEGAFKPLGQDALRGHELAMKEYEESNGERPIEAMIESTDGTPESVVAKARLLIEGGASIVIGPLAGIEGIALRDFAKSVPEVTFINGASAAQDATLRAPAENFFRFNPDSMQWIGGLGRYAYEEKDIETIVTISEDYSLPYTQLMGFVLDYCAAGGRLLARHWVSPGASDTTRLAERVARSETDGLFLAMQPAARRFPSLCEAAAGRVCKLPPERRLALRPTPPGPADGGDSRCRPKATTTSGGVDAHRESFPDAGQAPASSRSPTTSTQGAAPRPRRDEASSAMDTNTCARPRELFDTPSAAGRAREYRQAVTDAFIVESRGGRLSRLRRSLAGGVDSLGSARRVSAPCQAGENALPETPDRSRCPGRTSGRGRAPPP